MLEEKIFKDYQQALREGDSLKVSVLRFLRSCLLNTAIDRKKKNLDDNEVIAVIRKQINRIIETIEEYKKAKRIDLIQKEQKELEILQTYLPPPLSEEELSVIIDEVVKNTVATSIKDMGKVMKEVMLKVEGRADTKRISELVKEKLSSK